MTNNVERMWKEATVNYFVVKQRVRQSHTTPRRHAEGPHV